MVLVFKYAFFAFLATLVNLLCQDLTGRICAGPYELYLSMGVGTLAGLGIKYVLDKKYIFHYTTGGAGEDGRKFLMYAFMGVLTTLVFWGIEAGFDAIFGSKSMRYVGAVIGLSIGYGLKYRLDKRFVFAAEDP